MRYLSALANHDENKQTHLQGVVQLAHDLVQSFNLAQIASQTQDKVAKDQRRLQIVKALKLKARALKQLIDTSANVATTKKEFQQCVADLEVWTQGERLSDEQLCVWCTLCKIWEGCPGKALVQINEFILAKAVAPSRVAYELRLQILRDLRWNFMIADEERWLLRRFPPQLTPF